MLDCCLRQRQRQVIHYAATAAISLHSVRGSDRAAARIAPLKFCTNAALLAKAGSRGAA